MMPGGNKNDTNQNEQQFVAICQERIAPTDSPYSKNPFTQLKRRHPVLFILIFTLGLILITGLIWLFVIWRTGWQTPLGEVETIAIKPVAIDFSIPPPSEEEVDSWVVESSLPRYMNIPSLNMTRARIESLGLKTYTNQIDDPHDIWNVAWYNKSAKPGADGVGIYNCHTFFSPGGLCDGFDELPLGTEIKVERGDGVIFSYKIVENLTMTREEANRHMATLFELPNIAGVKQGIALITCAGTYDIYDGVASHRTMVRAILK